MKRAVLSLLLFCCVILMSASGFWMVRYFLTSKAQQDAFSQLGAEVTQGQEKNPNLGQISQFVSGLLPMPWALPTALPTAEPEQNAEPEHPSHDVKALREKNPDCIGWVTVPGTVIDYPLMHSPQDPEKYLHTAFDGTASDYGVPFLDSRCSLTSGNLILYGHNRFDGSMFTPIVNFPDKSVLDEHRTVYVELENEVREYELFASFKITADSELYTPFGGGGFLDAVREACPYDCGDIPADSQFVTLSTCDVSRENGRIIAVGVLKNTISKEVNEAAKKE